MENFIKTKWKYAIIEDDKKEIEKMQELKIDLKNNDINGFTFLDYFKTLEPTKKELEFYIQNDVKHAINKKEYLKIYYYIIDLKKNKIVNYNVDVLIKAEIIKELKKIKAEIKKELKKIKTKDLTMHDIDEKMRLYSINNVDLANCPLSAKEKGYSYQIIKTNYKNNKFIQFEWEIKNKQKQDKKYINSIYTLREKRAKGYKNLVNELQDNINYKIKIQDIKII